MAKKPSINTITTGYASAEALNENFEALRNALDNTLSLDGSTPNAMGADFDMNGFSILNADAVYVSGTDIVALLAGYRDAAIAAKIAAELAETNAESAAVAAGLSEANAGASETAAGVSEANAATSAATATTKASEASASALAASLSETNAASSETAAALSETAAALSETNAATSETNAGLAKDAAIVAQLAAEAAVDSIEVFYLGAETSDPTVDDNGDPLTAGAWYFNTVSGLVRIYNGTAWVNGSVDGTQYATAAQGTNADTAYSWGDHSLVGYLTSYTETDPIFTASVAFNITSSDTANWNTAYSWGDHAVAGYATQGEALALSIALG